MNNTKRAKIQGAIITALIFILLFSKNLPLLLTVYLTLSFTLLDVFNFIREQELKKTKEDDNKNFWSQTVTFIFFQLLTLGLLFLISWYFIKKIQFPN
jgi:hypothetical protein